MKNKGKKIYYRDWIKIWLLDKKNYVKESTYANYSNIVFNHLIPSLGNYKLNEINNKVLQELILSKHKVGRLDNNGGLSDKTIRDIGNVIKISFKSAMKNDLMNYVDLNLYYPRKDIVSKIYIFSKLEQRKIINYCLSNLNSKNIGILLTLYSGIRIGELCALKWEDIDFRKNILIINKTIQRVYFKEDKKSRIVITNPKTRNANREIPLNNNFAMLLKSIKTNNNNYILSNTSKYIEPRTYRKYYDKIIKKININNISFHSLRHTFASNCIRLGVDYKTVSELLGHSSVNITLNTYVHTQMSQKKKCINMIYKENNIEK